VKPILCVRGLTKEFGGVIANNAIDLELGAGEIHAIIGPNGAGKTTLMAQLTGELDPNAGTIEFDGRDIRALSMHQRAALGIARCYQITSVFMDFPSLDNVIVSVMATQRGYRRWWKPAISDPTLAKPAAALLERVGLGGRERTVAADLSHGERRQLELAMALATDPKLLLLDEPMAGMGPTETKGLIQLIGGLRENRSVLLIEHDMEAVFALAERISVLVNGTVIASGTPAAVAADRRVQEAYLTADETRHHA
jgi:branched-chain amino acid transport system ATP-binding protein